MTLRAVYQFVSGELYANMVHEIEHMAHAATAAVGEVGGLGQKNARQAMAEAGFSRKFQNAVRLNVYPAGKDSLHPAAVIRSKIPWAGVFQTGATIAGKPLIWVPLPNTPMAGGRRIPVGKYLETVGPLIAMKGTRKPMLGAYVRATDARIAKGLSKTLLKRGRNDGGRGTLRLVPLYVGVPSVTDPKKFDADAAIKSAADQLPAVYDKYMKQV